MLQTERRYLGDSVYAESDGYGGVTLTTNNGSGATNLICLESEVLAALLAFTKAEGEKNGESVHGGDL